MRSTGNILVLLAGTLASLTSAAQPAKPTLTYLYSVTFSGSAPIDFGATPLGNLSLTPLTGGSVVAVGGDWNLLDSQGNFHPDVRETFKTDDGAYIQIYQTGSGPQPGGVAHVHLSFVTGSPKYYWLNKVVAVGILKPVSQTDVTIDAWQVGTAESG